MGLLRRVRSAVWSLLGVQTQGSVPTDAVNQLRDRLQNTEIGVVRFIVPTKEESRRIEIECLCSAESNIYRLDFKDLSGFLVTKSKCKLCGTNHYPHEPHGFSDVIFIEHDDEGNTKRYDPEVSKDTRRKRAWRNKNRDRYTAYMKDFMRRKRSE